jgi:hypothetical protein
MWMPNFFKSKPFRAGFVCGLFLFVAANVRSYWTNPCFYEHGWCAFGLPFRCGYGFPFSPSILEARTAGLPFRDEIFWGGLVADVFIAVTVSILLGLLCNRLFKTKVALK